MAIYDQKGVVSQREAELKEKQINLQNDPGRIFLKAMAQVDQVLGPVQKNDPITSYLVAENN